MRDSLVETLSGFFTGGTTAPAAPVIEGHNVIRLLGQGAMGAVYLAEDTTLKRRVAVKVLRPEIAASEEARERFVREARAMAKIEHPGIVGIYGFGESGVQIYLTMQYVEGETLAERINRQGKLSVEEALVVTRQVVYALDAAWESGIVHRDIKPSNILIDRKGNVRVADFGLARSLEVSSDSSLTQAGAAVGTPHYISPEQAVGKKADFRSDIYSLGVVLYEMLTGDRPFAGTNVLELIGKHINEPLPAVTDSEPEISKEVADLVDWATNKDPESRPSSYQLLSQRISALLGEFTATETVLVPAAPERRAGGWWSPAPRWQKALAGFAVVSVLILAGWWVWPEAARDIAEPFGERGDSGLVVAVTPFYGPDEESAREGRVMAALVERAIRNRLGIEWASVLGVEETGDPVRNHEAARELGVSLGANLVVWGEVFVLLGETDIQPYLTMLPRPDPTSEPEGQSAAGALDRLVEPAGSIDPLAEFERQAAERVIIGRDAPEQVQLARTSAEEMGDTVLYVAGMYALLIEDDPGRALGFFEQAPETPSSLSYRAQALARLERVDEALTLLEEATEIGQGAGYVYARLGELRARAGRFEESAAAFRQALQIDGAYTSVDAFFHDDKIYTFDLRHVFSNNDEGEKTQYLIGIDPGSGRVVDRTLLPEAPSAFVVEPESVRIQLTTGGFVGFVEGRFDRPVYYAARGNLMSRMDNMRVGWTIATNYIRALDDPDAFPMVLAVQPDAIDDRYPATLAELEAAAVEAIERDPTQPWTYFLLAVAQSAQGKQEVAEDTFGRLVDGGFDATPYSEFAWMASFSIRLR